jgi:hypothetical protein
VQELQRMTTEYIEAEDRLRLTGELMSGETPVLWLSQRLLLRLLPHLLLWLERQRSTAFPTDIEQSFELRAASQGLGHEAPVQPAAHCCEWLVIAVDMNAAGPILHLTFRGANAADSVALKLQTLALRQWLSIVHALWSQAQWPASLWPEWMAQTEARRQAEKRALH